MPALLHRQTDRNKLTIFYLTRYRRGIIKNFIMKTLRNYVQLIGNLGQDVELREFDSGMKKASFSVATTNYFKNNSGEKSEKTEWHNVIAWGKLAERMTESLNKGDQVLIQGSIQHRSYQDNSGITRYITEVVAGEYLKIAKK